MIRQLWNVRNGIVVPNPGIIRASLPLMLAGFFGGGRGLGSGFFGGGGNSFSGAYDDYESSLVHVYEPARRTLTSYTGDLCRLRRGSDDAESDFGYDSNGNLDTSAISTWLGGGSGYLVTIYDQAGDDDITQATKADQPLYVASLQNGHPGMRLDGTNHYMQGAFTNGGALSQPFNLITVAKMDAAVVDTGYVPIVDSDDSSNRMNVYQSNALGDDLFAFSAGTKLENGATDSSWSLLAILANGASSEIRRNGASETTGNADSENADGITVGANYIPNNYLDGDIAVPAIIIDPALSSSELSDLESVINSYWSIY